MASQPATAIPTARPSTSSSMAVVEEAPPYKDKFIVTSAHVKVLTVNNNNCNLFAMVDTGSPISFIALRHVEQFLDKSVNQLDKLSATHKFDAIEQTPINILGKISASVTFENCLDRQFQLTFYVLRADWPDKSFIIGRDLLTM